MKYIEAVDNQVDLPMVELTRRNLEILLLKLDDPRSLCTLIDPDHRIAVRAVQNDAHYKAENRVCGAMYMPTEAIII